MSHENAKRTHATGIEGHATRKLAKNTRENCESSLLSSINNYSMKDYGKEFKSNRADAASILISFVTGVDGCNDILKDNSDIEAKLQSLKVKIPDYRDCINNNEKIAAWKIALIKPMLEADAYKTFMKSEKQQVKDSRRLVDGFQLERGLKLNKHLFDDFDTVELKDTDAGQIGFFIRSNMKSEKARKTLLLNAIKISLKKKTA